MSDIPPPPAVPPSTPPPPGGGSYTPPGGSYNPPPPPPGGGYTGGPGPGSGGDRTIMLILSYLSILALIPLFTKRDDPEVQWHAKNGLALTIFSIVIWIVLTIIGFVLPDIAGCGIATLSCILWVALVVIWILCIVKALQGSRFRIPVITDLAEKINI